MNFLGPCDNQLNDNQSDTRDGRFGGNREYSQTAHSKDYTARTGNAPNKKENPEDTTKDIDDMANSEARKREFSRREETSNTQKSNEAGWATHSDSDRRPAEDEDRNRGSKLRDHFGEGQYDNMPNRGYEGEIS